MRLRAESGLNSNMAQGVSSLLKRGMIDTLLQVLATTGVRFALVLAIFVLSRFVSNEEIATYDLFVVASSILLILMTFGLDSGLAVVANTADIAEQETYLWLSLIVSLLLALLLYLPLRFGATALGLGDIFDVRIFTTAYLYACANAVMTLLFSYYRWLGKAFVASLIVVFSNVIGFVAAAIAFATKPTVAAFVDGLLIGSFFGVLAALIYVFRDTNIPLPLKNARLRRQFLKTLIAMSWPFGVASFLLIARRAIDRALILAIGLSGFLGAYALVSRTGEIAAFVFALPAIGFAPIIVKEYLTNNGQHIARLLYKGYFVFSLLIMIAATLTWFCYGTALFPEAARPAAPIFLTLLASNLFFTETTVAGFGFVIVQRTWAVAILSLLFITVNLLVAIPLSFIGYGLEAVAAGFLIASFVHSTLFIYLSEKQLHFGYPLHLIFPAKLIVTLGILLILFQAAPL